MNVESGKGESCTELEGIQHETSLLSQTILKTVVSRDFVLAQVTRI